MNLKKTGATIILVLFCCILYAKEGYRISLRIIDSTGTSFFKSSLFTPDSSLNTATLSLLGWKKDSIINTVSVNKKGEFLFAGKKSLEAGEYIIKWNGKPIELFVSRPDLFVNEKLILQNNRIIQKKGSAENGHFTRFQNLINYGWRELSTSEQLQHKLDSLALLLENGNLQNSMFALMLDAYCSQDYITGYIKDKRILNTSFGKKFITNYFTEIEYNTAEDVIQYIDSILSGADKDVASLIGIEAFSYFKEPKVMGHESVAFHIAKEYFLNGKLDASELVKFEMNTYIMLNEKSLLGMPAQELKMRDTTGTVQSLHEFIKQGKYTIIYFYTDDCVTCKIETPKLVDFVNNYSNGKLNVYAVYTQDKKDRWIKYIHDNLQVNNPNINWTNVWDPEIENGFHMLYNVVSTPQIFVVDFTGTIIGRGLNVNALKDLISQMDEILDMLKDKLK